MDPRQDFLPRQGDPLPEGDHAVRVHGVPAVEEDDLVALHDCAHGQEGRQVEHEVGAAVDQRDLARLEGTEDPIEGRHEGREGRARLDADLRDEDGVRGEGDEILPAIQWRWRYKVRDRGGVTESTLEDSASRSYPQESLGCWSSEGCDGLRGPDLFPHPLRRSVGPPRSLLILGTLITSPPAGAPSSRPPA